MTLSEEDKLKLTQTLFTSSSFRLIPELLNEMEEEALNIIRNDSESPGESVLTIKLVEKFRNTLRALARGAGVKYD